MVILVTINVRNEIKSEIVKSGWTLTDIVKEMNQLHPEKPTTSQNISSKLTRGTLKYAEALEIAASKAIEKFGNKTAINAVAYFGDESSVQNGEIYNDGLVSIKSLGRIRQKYASNDTLMVLNFQNYILITTIGEYLPKKFEQGYKIS